MFASVIEWQIIFKTQLNIQETTFFRSVLTAFLNLEHLSESYLKGTEPGIFPEWFLVEPEKIVWGSEKAAKNDRQKGGFVNLCAMVRTI